MFNSFSVKMQYMTNNAMLWLALLQWPAFGLFEKYGSALV